MLFVVHAVDKTDMLPIRAKFYRAHRIHLDDAANYDVDVVTAGTLVADDGETPVGSADTSTESRSPPLTGSRRGSRCQGSNNIATTMANPTRIAAPAR